MVIFCLGGRKEQRKEMGTRRQRRGLLVEGRRNGHRTKNYFRSGSFGIFYGAGHGKNAKFIETESYRKQLSVQIKLKCGDRKLLSIFLIFHKKKDNHVGSLKMFFLIMVYQKNSNIVSFWFLKLAADDASQLSKSQLIHQLTTTILEFNQFLNY